MFFVSKGLKEKTESELIQFFLAGVVGFEPTDVGVRVQCLTAWRHPNKRYKVL